MISKNTYEEIIQRSLLTSRVDQSTGEIDFEYNNFHVSMSWNHKVIFKVDDHCYSWDPGLKQTIYSKCLPFIKFEFSVPKILYGQNIDSSTEIIEACFKVKTEFEKKFSVVLPALFDWFLYRIDTCANFILQNIDQVKAYIRYLQRFDYPRRIKNLYSDTGIYFASRQNTLKIYCKGAEFKKHDAIRFQNEFERIKLQKKANCILRVEVEHKNRLRYIIDKIETEEKRIVRKFQGYMTLFETIKYFYIGEEMERVMKKLLCGIETKVMRNLDVYKIMKEHLGKKSANFYYAIYMLLITQGQNETKRQITKSTYYKALSIFREFGISIIASDIEKTDYFIDQGFPGDFNLSIDKTNKYYQLPLAA